MTSDLDRALGLLYRCFPEYHNIRDLENHSCPHCNLGQRIRPLLGDRIGIKPEDLVFYSMKAMTTCGTVEHFKHFLPRLFETSDALCRGGPPLEWIGDKLKYGGWRSWSQTEVDAVRAILVAILGLAVSRPAAMSVSDCYEILDQTEWIDWLGSIDGVDLVSVVVQQGQDFMSSGRPQRYFDDLKALDERLGAGRLGQLLEDAFFDRDGDDARVLSNVHLLLDRHGVLSKP